MEPSAVSSVRAVLEQSPRQMQWRKALSKRGGGGRISRLRAKEPLNISHGMPPRDAFWPSFHPSPLANALRRLPGGPPHETGALAQHNVSHKSDRAKISFPFARSLGSVQYRG